MGHANIETTMDIYAEATAEKRKKQSRIYQKYKVVLGKSP